MTRATPEHHLQVAVIQHLMLVATADIFWCAIPNGEYRSPRTAARLKAEGVRAGAPDLLLIRNGKPYGLELKVKGNRQSASQRAVERDWKAAGGDYKVATGIDEALAALVGWGFLPRSHVAQCPFYRQVAA